MKLSDIFTALSLACNAVRAVVAVIKLRQDNKSEPPLPLIVTALVLKSINKS